jgi:glycosyltransferase involved in cell wall biosynthesis
MRGLPLYVRISGRPEESTVLRREAALSNRRVAFIYWGRRGALCRFTLEAARVVSTFDDIEAFFSVSTANELYSGFNQFSNFVFPVDTFRTNRDLVFKALRILRVRHQLLNWLRQQQIRSVVVLMPHVWTPLVGNMIKRAGMHYAVLIHDAKPHPGDPSGLFTRWLLRDARRADTVFTLSRWVTEQLVSQATVPAERIRTLFMPDLIFPQTFHSVRKRPRSMEQPLRVLFFGRLLPYKGLELFCDAMKILAAEHVPVEITVSGEGELGKASCTLQSLGARIDNRWITDDEVGRLLMDHDLVVLTHREASQSGVISAALGAGVPVVTTPVGGLGDQVRSRGAGLVADRVDAQAIADCIRIMARDTARYNSIVERIRMDRSASISRFIHELVAALPAS